RQDLKEFTDKAVHYLLNLALEVIMLTVFLLADMMISHIGRDLAYTLSSVQKRPHVQAGLICG
ncbi:MAG: hypothetical protein M0T81_02735, partial [Thermoplasmatales archaeon]|nr:hypothetical protein [Thermoplasmatales archaeon]